ncbi:MAG TPA: response regulator [Thermoanaerobaculia bacterium]
MPTILLVEDDEPTRVLIAALCRRIGVDIDLAGDGAHALELIRRRPYSALLLDLMLPKMNGFELLREIRSCRPALLCRTIILTAVSDATLRDFDGGGTLALLRKPFDIADLIDALIACCGDAPVQGRVSANKGLARGIVTG